MPQADMQQQIKRHTSDYPPRQRTKKEVGSQTVAGIELRLNNRLENEWNTVLKWLKNFDLLRVGWAGTPDSLRP
jgi:hypothetical protein